MDNLPPDGGLRRAGPGAGRPDPLHIATQQDFGRELTLARLAAGLTVRQVARAAGLPASTAGDYFAARHLPPVSQPDLLPRVLAACGITGQEVVDQWTAALVRVRRPPGRRPGRAAAPYRGLASFQAEDAGWFFGREELTAELVRRAAQARAAGLPLGVTGPSGSGKSSLLRAGLIPALLAAGGQDQPAAAAGRDPAGSAAADDPGGPRVVLFTPGPHPAAALRDALPASDPLAVVIDQFEETFTACQDVGERREFIGSVCALAARTLVVLGLRADCYGQALRYPSLALALGAHQVVVGPMTAGQLRRAIVEPARQARMDVADGLVSLLLRDLAPRVGGETAAHEPGALPLLSHALRATWERSSGSQLTVAAYEASGGISDAIARTAEQVYEQLAPAQQNAARRLFLRLVEVRDDSAETRHQVPLDDLAGLRDPGPGDPAPPPVPGNGEAEVLAAFTGQRLITLGENTAEISHEALLAAWPRLRDWIEADREQLRIRHRISDRARLWADSDRDPGVLPRGTQLALIRDWAADPGHAASLDALGREFVGAATAHEQHEAQVQRRRTRRLQRLVAALTALVLIAGALAGYALAQRHNAISAHNQADSRQLGVEAQQLLGHDPSLAAQLSVAASHIAPSEPATTSLLEASGSPLASRLVDSAQSVQAVAVSPGRTVLAVAAADGTLRLWDIARPGRPGRLSLVTGPAQLHPLYAVAFSPDGRLLAAAGQSGTVGIWDVAAPARPVRLASLPAPRWTGPGPAPLPTVYSVAFSPDGTQLAAGSNDGRVWRWDIADPRHPRPLPALAGPGGPVQSVAFSLARHLLAAGSAGTGAGGEIRLWDAAGSAHPASAGRPFAVSAAPVSSVAFSPPGTTLAAGSHDHTVHLWNLTHPARPRPLPALTGATDWVNAVSFSPDGAELAAASSDDTVRVWSAASGRLMATLPNPGVVTSAVWDGGHLLADGDTDGIVRTWQLPDPVLATAGPVNSVAFGARGSRLAVGGTDLELWDPRTRTELGAVPVSKAQVAVNAVGYDPRAAVVAAGYDNGEVRLFSVAGPVPVPASPPLRAAAAPAGQAVEFAAFSPDGRLLATAADDGTVRLWNVTDPARPVLEHVIRDSGTYVFCVAFSPDGRTLAAASADDLTKLWDVSRPARPQLLATLPRSHDTDYSVAFSPDGRTLAVGSADLTIRLWDVADRSRPRPLGAPLTGPEGYVYALAFGPGGRTLAAGSTDDTVWLWRVANPAQPVLLADLTGAAGHIYSVGFSPDGTTMAAGSADGTVRLWGTSAAAEARSICRFAGQPVTRAEWRRYDPGRGYDPPCP